MDCFKSKDASIDNGIFKYSKIDLKVKNSFASDISIAKSL